MTSSIPGPHSLAGRCPICGGPCKQDIRPFCSRRCADVDLSRWLNGAYAIAGGNAEADEDGDDASIGRREATRANPPVKDGADEDC